MPTNANSNKNNYITIQHKLEINVLIKSMFDIQGIRDNFESTFFSKHKIKDKSKYLGFLLKSEKGVYDTMLAAHAEGYFEKYSREQIMGCLNGNINTNPWVCHEIGLENIKTLQNDLESTLYFILIPSKQLAVELLKLNEDKLYNLIDPFIEKLRSARYQLNAYCADQDARRDEVSKN